MRLSSKETNAIISTFKDLSGDKPFRLYLFGSRTDDSKRGGDIDLLLVTTEDNKDFFVNLKSRLRHTIFENISEQKIDITVVTFDESKTDLFFKAVYSQAVLLIENK